MNEELDLRKQKWVISRDLYLDIINNSLMENYPNVDLNKEIEIFGCSFEDLLDESKLKNFFKYLNEKYPE